VSPAARWILSIAILVAGVGTLAAALRERRQAPSVARSPRPPADSSDAVLESELSEESSPPGGAESGTSMPSLAEARIRLHRPGATSEERRDVLRDAARDLPRAEARTLLLEVLLDPAESFPTRAMALALLPGVRDPEGEDIEVLRRMLSDRTFPAPHLVAHALGQIDDPRAVSILADTVRRDLDDSTRVQAAAALAPRAAEEPATSALKDAALADRSESVRLIALSALLDSGSPQAKELARLLVSLDSTPPRLRVLAQRSLGEGPRD